MLKSYHFDKMELKITIFLNFQVYHRNEKNFESSCGFGGRHLKIRDVCMDLEPCFKVHNLVVIQLNNTKLGRMTNFKVVFHMMLFYKFDPVPCSTSKWPISLVQLVDRFRDLTSPLNPLSKIQSDVF